jgi:DNA-binding CsgD family transcriptional regulator
MEYKPFFNYKAQLTPHEIYIISLIQKNLTPRKIMEELNVTENTYHTTLKRICGKLDVNKRIDLYFADIILLESNKKQSYMKTNKKDCVNG